MAVDYHTIGAVGVTNISILILIVSESIFFLNSIEHLPFFLVHYYRPFFVVFDGIVNGKVIDMKENFIKY